MSQQHYRSPFGDTTFTRVFVGGLAWETPTDVMREYFEQFGEILEAVVITDKSTGKSKGYGFVTYGDAESARRACADPNPVVDGRRANCNIASLGLGRTRPSAPPRGAVPQGASPSYRPPPLLPPPLLHPPLPPPPPPVMYPPYGYPTYSPDYRHPQQTFYNPQLHHPQYYHHQLCGPSLPSAGSPYFSGHSNPQATFSRNQAQRIQGSYYPYYPMAIEGGSFSAHQSPPPLPPPSQPITAARHPVPSSTDSLTPQQTSTEAEVAATASETPKTQGGETHAKFS